MGLSSGLRIRDIEGVFNLVGECRELWCDSDAWRAHLMDGTCRLTGTAVGFYSELRVSPGRESIEILHESDRGWRDNDARSNFVQMMVDHPDRLKFLPRVFALADRARAGGDATALRSDVLPSREWRETRVYNEYCRPAFIDEYVLSFALNRQTDTFVMLTTNRDLADPAPTQRARAILSLLNRQIAPLVGTVLVSAGQRGMTGLSPRLRETLIRLLHGDGEKQIAEQMGLSRPTVHEYVGAIYRHFNVGTRAELLAYFLHRRPVPVTMHA